MRRVFLLVTIVSLLAGFCLCAHAAEAEDITAATSLWRNDRQACGGLTDGLEIEAIHIPSDLSVYNENGIAFLYLVFDDPCAFAIQDVETGKSVAYRSEGFLHVLADLESRFGYLPQSINLQFPDGAWLAEVKVFSAGALPPEVQNWQQPLTGSADIVLFSTHGDDEQLYFAGLLPHYAGELGLNVQVVYMTDHRNLSGSIRQHEMLNGLWAVGVRAYPVFGTFPDFKIMSRDKTYDEFENLGHSREDLLRFVVGNLRRFRPLVAVGHDLEGEYGHGMHRVYADLLTRAVEVSADETVFSDQVSTYGVWDVPKTYLHLYPENRIVMDWDQPLERFGGMTAFEVTQKRGFPCHVTQQYDLYVNWLYGGGGITRADQIEQWNPCKYGLYRTTVGEDVEKNDLMEHLTSYGEVSRRSEEQDQQLRNTVLLAKTRNASEPQLLRPAAESVAIEAEAQQFPTFAAMTAILAAAALAWILYKIKILQKK